MPSNQDHSESGEQQHMQGYFVRTSTKVAEDEIDLTQLWRELTRYKVMFLALVSASVALAVLVAVIVKPVYRSEILLAPAVTDSSQGGLAALASQFGGLASLAGINIGGSDNTSEVIAILKSRSFTQTFIQDEDLMGILFADEWNTKDQTWDVDDVSDIPTAEDAFELFDEEIRSVTTDNETGLVTLAIEWTDRDLAASWANILIERLNQFVRFRDIEESERSIEFLTAELEKRSGIELRQGIFGLIERQVETAMLANVREEYVFRVLDVAVPADEDKYIWPLELLFVFIGFFVGIVIALAATVVRNSLRIDRP